MAIRLYGDALYTFSSHYQKLMVEEISTTSREDVTPRMDYFYKNFVLNKKLKRPMLQESYKFNTAIFCVNEVVFGTSLREIGAIPLSLVSKIGFLPFYIENVFIDSSATKKEAVAAIRFGHDARGLIISPAAKPLIFTQVLNALSSNLGHLECSVQVFDYFGVDKLRLKSLKLLWPARIGGIFALMDASVSEIDLSEFGDLALNELFFHIHEYKSNRSVKVVRIKLESDTGIWTIRNLMMNLNWMFPNLEELKVIVSDERFVVEMRSFNFADFFLHRYISSDLALEFQLKFELNFNFEHSTVSSRTELAFPEDVDRICNDLLSIVSKLDNIISSKLIKNGDFRKYEIIQKHPSKNITTTSHVGFILPLTLRTTQNTIFQMSS
uniref:UmuC domain-containing protein n=1 Tax=Bursaphelenchus xylophilus TaxID=6326 RepID=A0A1I7RZ03_BURXY